ALQDGIECTVNLAMPAGSDFAAQLELPHLHRHHDGKAAALARLNGQRREVSGNENFGLTPAARDHLQWLFARIHCASNRMAIPAITHQPQVSSHGGAFLLVARRSAAVKAENQMKK